MICDFYQDLEKYQSLLAQVGLSRWAGEIHDAVRGGATGAEILLKVRWVLTRMLNENTIAQKVSDPARDFVEYINRALQA